MLVVLVKFVLVCIVVCPTIEGKSEFATIFEWTQLEFDYPNEYERQRDIDICVFIPGRPAPIDTDVYYSKYSGENKIFVTIPRFQPGVPAALGTISNKTRNGNYIITPYPSWRWHRDLRRCNEDRILSPFRVKIDECERLWIMDTGMLDGALFCPPQILIFDLRSDQLIHRYEIPKEQYEGRSIFVTIAVDILDWRNNNCEDTFAYIGDSETYSIVVYDMKNAKSWKISDKTMHPHPDFGSYNVQGDRFDLMDGILGMCLSPDTDGSERKLFYHAMSSPTENWVYTYDLRNESLSTSPQPSLFHTFPNRRETQAAAAAIDRNGIMYFGLIGDVKLACYNTRLGDYGSSTSSDIVGDDPVTMQFPTGVKVVRNKKDEDELWILTSRFQRVITQKITSNEVNFRIIAAKVSNVVTETQCMHNYDYYQIANRNTAF